MKVISIVNRKGGVGKTTTAQNLGAGLKQAGYKVLFVDLDSQENLSLCLNASEDYISSYDVLQGEDIKHAVQHMKAGDVIRGDFMLSSITMKPADTFKKQLDKIKNKYDFVVIDTPPSMDPTTINAITASDQVIITSQSDLFSYQGIITLLETLSSIKQKYNNGLQVNGILLTRYNKRANIQQQYREAIKQLAEESGTRLYDANIRECNALKEAQAMQTDIFTYSKNSNAAKDYKAFISEYLGKEI